MEELSSVAVVVGMFLFRVGIPFVLLIILGTLIERRQQRRKEQIAQMYILRENFEEKAEQKKAA